MSLQRLFVFFFFLMGTTNGIASVPAAQDFMTGLVNLAVQSKLDSGNLSPETKAKLKALSDKVDYPKLAAASLGAHWKKAKAAEQKDFIFTFQEIMESILFPKASRIQLKGEGLKYSQVAKKPTHIRVVGQIEREKRGDLVIQDLDLTLIFDSKAKKIIDAEVDGERVSTNLKRQFDKALQKKKFVEIISQMRKRVSDARAKKS